MIKKIFRTLQTYAPAFLEFKFYMQRLIRRLLKRPSEADFDVLRHFKDGRSMLFLDVGANRGQSIDTIRLFLKDVDIVAFEPDGRLFKKLSDQYVNDNNLKIYNFGLGDKEGSFTLYTPVYNGWAFDGLASFDESSARGWINSETVIGYDEKKLIVESQLCQIKTMDSLNLSPAFIKIDVQGLEGLVIRGGFETLKRCKPILLIETGEEGFESETLKELGYLPASYEAGLVKIGICGKQNTIFIHESKLSEFDSFSVDCR